ncbi:hypothetical protein RND81_13G067700 [Saponaria officinalis]|uniref:Exo_endo_phos domain-containing protein n=1 Tax=Saponaria officinalis TaxID=3572 RepID=A0AAW1H387_SAPOF
MVYAFNDTNERKVLWQRMNVLRTSIAGPWVMCGDFNTVLSPMERMGGRTTNEEMDDFRNCIEDCGLFDGYVTGCFFTWNNKQGPEMRVYSRLDRFLVNQHWFDSMPDAYAHFHNEGLFDHTPCTIQVRCADFKSRRSFKYFNMWSSVDEFLPCVAQTWKERIMGTKMFSVVKRLQHLKHPLKQLNKALFDDVENDVARANVFLDFVQQQLHSDPMNSDWIEKKREAAKTFCELKHASDNFLTEVQSALDE